MGCSLGNTREICRNVNKETKVGLNQIESDREMIQEEKGKNLF